MAVQEVLQPPIREFADRGVLWLLESPENLRGLVQLVSQPIAESLNFKKAERINRSFIPEDLHKQEADLLYQVPFGTGKKQVWVYVLVEHQSKTDKTMGLRLLSYMVQIWERQRREYEDDRIPPSRWRLHPIIPIVFYSGKKRWTAPISVAALMELPALFAEFVPSFRTLHLKLNETSAEELSGSAVALALRTLQAVGEPTEGLAAVLAEVVKRLEPYSEEAYAEWKRAMIFMYLLIQHKRAAGEQEYLREVVQEALEPEHWQEVEEIIMTGAQALEAKGRREGLREGRTEKGRELLLKQLESKFGPLSSDQVAALNALSDSQIDQMAIRLLTAASLEELGL